MDQIQRSNRTLSRALIEANQNRSWLTATTYEECAYLVVTSSLMKKFEEPNDKVAKERREACINDFLRRNSQTPTNIGYWKRQVGYASLTLMNELRCTFANWLMGAVFSLNDGWVGPGESFAPSQGHTSALAKFSREIEVTPSALPLLRKYFRRSNRYQGRFIDLEFKIVPGNRVTTVRKNNEKDRVICTEPSGNMILQKALGAMFRRVYRKTTGRDLNYVQDLHKRIVREGHWNGKSIVTIDLSAASDSISMLLVESVLPPWVVELIQSVRSPLFCLVQDDGTYKTYPARIVSTMGNGFTFELLTLVMSALCDSTGGEWSVYGDDIIIETAFAEDLIRKLEILGFAVNIDKSCIGVPQLESCGAFSFDGLEIKRYEAEWCEHESDVCSVMNKLLDLHDFYKGLHDDLAVKLWDMWFALYCINRDTLPAGPNLDSNVSGQFMRVPEELYPTHQKKPRAWCDFVASTLHIPPQLMWEVEAWYFEPEVIDVRRPRNHAAYTHVFLRNGAAPKLTIRNAGSWVRKVTLYLHGIPEFSLTRKKWNEYDKPQKSLSGSCVELRIPRMRPKLPADLPIK